MTRTLAIVAALSTAVVVADRIRRQGTVRSFCSAVRARTPVVAARTDARRRGLAVEQVTVDTLGHGDQFDDPETLDRRGRWFDERTQRSDEPIVTVYAGQWFDRVACEIDHRAGAVTATRLVE